MTDIKIDPATKDLWVQALEGGTYKQAPHHLFDGYGYCCLGVLCRAKQATFEVPLEEGEDEDGDPVMVPMDGASPIVTLNGERLDDGGETGGDMLNSDTAPHLFGITTPHQNLFVALNDGSASRVSANDPLIEVWRKVATFERECPDEAEMISFETRRHSFAEIAGIIKTYF